jgi:hypothetical protein
MRHGATNPARDSRLPSPPHDEADRKGIRSLDCGHEASQDGDLTIRRSGKQADRESAPIGLVGGDGATSLGEQQQAV